MTRTKLLSQGVTVPEKFVRSWEAAYRAYGEASEQATRAPEGDVAAAQRMSGASHGVASASRNLATARDLPWWVLVALESAAEAFEAQSHVWAACTAPDSGKGPA